MAVPLRRIALKLRNLVSYNPNRLPKALHRLIRSYFRRLATFGATIDSDLTIGNHELALPAAVSNSGEFEQVAKRDVFPAQFEFQGVHSYAPRRRHR